jgi:diguanylate cyclase
MAAVDAPDAAPEPPTPPFGLPEAERIVRRLAPALHAHGMWVQRIHATLVCRTQPRSEDLQPEGHRAAELGHWFADENNEFIRRHPEYAQAAERHREVHARARALCAASAEGRDIPEDDYRAFAEALLRLDASLESLVKELWDLLRFTDPLTGIATRYAMLPRLREEHSRVQRTGMGCTVCMVDLDRFKQINDTWGHRAGDRVLAAVSAYLVANLRRYDQVCRYGGEEFVLMLPNTELAQAVPIVDRLRRGLSELSIPIDSDTQVKITASIGIAPLIADQPISASIERADLAMYEAKRAGRDQVRVWNGEDAAVAANDSITSPTSG